jgi:hypothetical protein|tara:strand:+ start:5412 stop:5951 length:540 start_codon:yes stop_codon:yes gene_type:complete
MNLKIYFTLFLLFTVVFPIGLNAQTKKEIRKQKALVKKEKQLEKLKNPNWLKIENNIGYFTDNKDTYVESNSMKSKSEQLNKFINRDEFIKNELSVGTGVLEKKIIQIALFKSDLTKLEIRIESSCSGGYRGSTTLIVYEKDLENLRKVNNIKKFQRGYNNTPLNVYKQIELAVKSLCF